MKFTLIAEDEPWFTSISGTVTNATTKRTVEFRADSLTDIITEFDLFLKGSGYVFDHLEVHDDNEDDEFCESETQEDLVFDEETAGPILHSPAKMKVK
jgi:hypothetical protein